MSMLAVANLKHKAQTSKDPEKLRRIAAQLREYSELEEARKADNRAFEIEKKQGEKVGA